MQKRCKITRCVYETRFAGGQPVAQALQQGVEVAVVVGGVATRGVGPTPQAVVGSPPCGVRQLQVIAASWAALGEPYGCYWTVFRLTERGKC